MPATHICRCLLVAALAGPFNLANAATDPIRFNEGLAVARIDVTADPPAGVWRIDQHSAARITGESTGGYQFTLVRSERGQHACWTLQLQRSDGKPFRIREYAWEARVPLGDVVVLFNPQIPEAPTLFRQAPQIDVAIEVRPNAGVPFMLAGDHYGRSSLAVGPMDQAGTYRLTGRRDGEHYAISVARTEYVGDEWFSGTEFTDGFFVSTAKDFWFDTARAYADAVDAHAGYTPRPIPAAALKPYYSTWYAFGEDINEQIVWGNAKLAAEMGVGNFIIFIGWAQCSDWFSSANTWGDYTACTPKFPDLAGLVKRMQRELGLAVHLWTAPTWIGSGSESFARMKDHRSKWPGGDYDRNLDPRSPAARQHIRERFAFMARQLGVDGYYVDFLDTIYNRNDAPHEKDPLLFGIALEQFLGECYNGFAGEHPAPVALFRQPFANLLTKRHASVFTTTYTDHRWDRNRLLAMAYRPFTRGVAFTCDPLVWSREEFDDRELVAKSLSAVMMCGVPGISMDLTKMNADRRAQIKAWFDFYTTHARTFTEGEFRPFGREFHYPEMMISRGSTAFAWVSRWETGEIPLPEGTTHAFIFTNLPREESFIARVDLTAIRGLVPGRYLARRFNNALESHEEPMVITVAPQPPRAAGPVIKTPRENWDWHPDENRPSLDIARGGFWEFKRTD